MTWRAPFGFVVVAWWLSGCAAIPQSPQAVGTYHPSQTIELYDAAGRRTGYGNIQGGTIELFNPNSTRMGFGKTGR